jgi:hypothetical protein
MDHDRRVLQSILLTRRIFFFAPESQPLRERFLFQGLKKDQFRHCVLAHPEHRVLLDGLGQAITEQDRAGGKAWRCANPPCAKDGGIGYRGS